MSKALIIKNIQNDFLDLGATPIEGAEASIEAVNAAIQKFEVVIAIQKWYPADHQSFAANHPWRKPDQVITIGEEEVKLEIINCVADSFGAALPAALNQEKINYIIKNEGKGADAVMAAINRIVEEHKIEEIEVMGPGVGEE